MIIVDVEIKKAICGRNEERLPDIEYCGGWRDFANMGISCVCTYDITTHLSRVFLEEDLGALAVYLWKKPTAGFNTKRFDNCLLHEHGVDIDESMHYDMLEQIWVALGLNPDKFNPHTHGGWGLDAVCGATLGIYKTGHGATAPVWWQQGRHGKVIDYCLNDVWMEGQLLRHILAGGLVAATRAGKLQSVRVWLPAFQPVRAAAVAPADNPLQSAGVELTPATGDGASLGRSTVFAADTAADPPTTVATQTTSGGLGIIR
jgi:hypothetical protein